MGRNPGGEQSLSRMSISIGVDEVCSLAAATSEVECMGVQGIYYLIPKPESLAPRGTGSRL